MLQRILDAHPEMACTYDTHFIIPILKRLEIGADPSVDEDIIERVTTHPRFDRLKISVAEARELAARSAHFSEWIAEMYRLFAEQHGKRFAIDKSPGHCRHLPRLHAVFPETRIVHLLRDGRDVTLSVLDWGRKGPARLGLFDREPVAVCALWWRYDIAKGCADGRRLGASHYLELRYEELVADPPRAAQELAQFLDVRYAPEMVQYHRGRERQAAHLSAKAAWAPPTAGLRDWRTQLSERDLAVFEALAGEQLIQAGYELSDNPIPDRIRRIAKECENWWRNNVPRRSLERLDAR